MPTGPKHSWAMISEKPRMAFSGVRSSWLILARKAVLEALAVSASKRFLQRFVAGLLQFARQILDLEAQARILLHADHQRPAGEPHLEREQRRGNGDGIIQSRIAERRSARWSSAKAAPGARRTSPCCCRAPAPGPRPPPWSGGEKQVIDRIAVIPQQPGHRAPGGADGKLHGAMPRYHSARSQSGSRGRLLLIDRGHRRRRHHRRRHDKRQDRA